MLKNESQKENEDSKDNKVSLEKMNKRSNKI
jgi:hypothetical protein